MKRTSPEEKLEWARRIQEQSKSGQSISRWCHERNLPYNTFLYWRDQLPLSNSCAAPLQPAPFKELVEPSRESGVVIEYRGVRLHLSKQFDQLVFMQCLASLKELQC